MERHILLSRLIRTRFNLGTSASNANNSTAISLSSGAAGGSHTLNLAFDGTNTKFKAPTETEPKQRSVVLVNF